MNQSAAESPLESVGICRRIEIADALVENADRLVDLARERAARATDELHHAVDHAVEMRARRAAVIEANDSDEGSRSATSVLGSEHGEEPVEQHVEIDEMML